MSYFFATLVREGGLIHLAPLYLRVVYLRSAGLVKATDFLDGGICPPDLASAPLNDEEASEFSSPVNWAQAFALAVPRPPVFPLENPAGGLALRLGVTKPGAFIPGLLGFSNTRKFVAAMSSEHIFAA